MTNPWRPRPVTENTYYRTAFRVARVRRDMVERATIAQRIGQTRNLVQDPQAHTISGIPVNQSEINEAEKVLLSPGLRVLEELLEHAPEEPPLEEVKKLADQVRQSAPVNEDPLTVANLEGLLPWVRELAMRQVEHSPPLDPLFGAAELGLTPPFGRPEEDE